MEVPKPIKLKTAEHEAESVKREEERNAKAAFLFEQAKTKVLKFCSHFVVKAQYGFMVRKKLGVRTPKGFRGYVGLEGQLSGPYVLFTVTVGYFHPTSGLVAAAFPIFQAGTIEQAVKYAKLKNHAKNLKNLLRIL